MLVQLLHVAFATPAVEALPRGPTSAWNTDPNKYRQPTVLLYDGYALVDAILGRQVVFLRDAEHQASLGVLRGLPYPTVQGGTELNNDSVYLPAGSRAADNTTPLVLPSLG